MVKIDKFIDWVAIKSEYIGGGISQRKLAEKYGIKPHLLLDRANREKWAQLRENAANAAQKKAEQKIANEKAKNADIAERIRGKLLKRLEAEIDRMPEDIGTESATSEEITDDNKRTKHTKVMKLRDLVAAYHDLVGTDLKREKLEIDRKKAEDW